MRKFFYGFAISAYQNEGKNYNSDWYVYEKRGYVPKFENQFELWNNYETLVPILKDLNVNAFRFSLEWARIYQNREKIDYNSLRKYLDFTSKLINNDIEPFITLWHFTNPVWFMKLGGWLYEENINYYLDYVDTILKNFTKIGVKYFITFNEVINYVFLHYTIKAIYPFNEIESFESLKKIFEMIDNMRKASEEATKIIKSYDAISIHTENLSKIKIGKVLFFNILPDIGEFLQTFYPKNVDMYGINYYGIFESYKDIVNRNNKLVVSNSLIRFLKKMKKDVVFTEVGINTQDEFMRFTSIRKFLFFCIKNREKYRIRGVFIWTLYDNYEWDFGYNAKFGIMNRDLSKKDSYYQFKELFNSIKKYFRQS